ncbi:MAG: DUF86 domain-containing protein [Spirochaetia bacterium]
MDSDIVLAKLDSLRRCVSRVEEKTPSNVEVLKDDYDIQDIIALNLERAVQISVDIAAHILSTKDTGTPATMGETFTALSEVDVISTELAERLRKAVGFRNISVHEYKKIDWEIVFSICTKHMKDFREYATGVLAYYNID